MWQQHRASETMHHLGSLANIQSKQIKKPTSWPLLPFLRIQAPSRPPSPGAALPLRARPFCARPDPLPARRCTSACTRHASTSATEDAALLSGRNISTAETLLFTSPEADGGRLVPLPAARWQSRSADRCRCCAGGSGEVMTTDGQRWTERR